MTGLSVTDAEVREGFDAAADWFLDIVDRAPEAAWSEPGLGVWTVRELAAHARRAFTTIESYLEQAPDGVEMPDPVTYFRVALSFEGVNDLVATRARDDAATLGDDPAAAIRATAQAVRVRVDAVADDEVCGSAVGGMRFVDYLATRVFELTTHTVDLCRALRIDDPAPEPAARVTLALLAGLAAAGPHANDVIAALTGRAEWPEGGSVLG